ncbi:protein of unknown function [Tenacibaculum aestuariivivum]
MSYYISVLINLIKTKKGKFEVLVFILLLVQYKVFIR